MNFGYSFVFSFLIFVVLGICSCSDPPPEKKIDILVIVHNNSESTAEITEFFMHRLSKKISPDYGLVIEQARDNSIVSLFSQQ